MLDFLESKTRLLYKKPRALLAGWFSYDNACATFGDTEAMYVAADWLEAAGVAFDIACHHVNGLDGLDIDSLDPSPYSIFVFVCGPWRSDSIRILDRFEHCYKIGLDLTLEAPVHLNHGFDVLLARDMPGYQNPDLVFSKQVPTLPLVGVAQVHPQKMYGDRQRHEVVGKAIEEFLALGQVVPVTLDTLHVDNPVKLKNVLQYENLVGRLDAVISTRLHGVVFALKRGVPVVAIDAIAGGGKVSAQAKAIGWPLLLDGDTVTSAAICAAVQKCLDGSMGDALEHSNSIAKVKLKKLKSEFLHALPVGGARAATKRGPGAE